MNQTTVSDQKSLAQLDRRLAEAWQSLWDSVVDPHEALHDDGDTWQPLGRGLSGSGAPGALFRSEAELHDIRTQCRALALENEFAINGHENRISYLVGCGHTYRATACRCDTIDEALIGETQAVIDDFLAENHWHRRQQEIVRRADRDGEVFLRLFSGNDTTLRVRFVEPDQVFTPRCWTREPDMSFGIETDPQDVETARAYYLDGERVPADQIQHRKANVDCNVKRGLPLFYPVRKNLRRAEKLLRNMSIVAEIQSAIALVRKHRGATRSGVQQFVASQTDRTMTSSSGQTTSFRRFGPGTILDSHGGIEYDFPASGLDASNFVTVLQAELRAVASRLVMPEFMLTSDASNANYASTMIAEGPAIRMFSRLQSELVCDDLWIMRKAIQHAIDLGRLPADTLQHVEVQAVAPTLAVRDVLQEAQAARIEYECGILSPQTWSQRRGLDYDQEQNNWVIARMKKEN